MGCISRLLALVFTMLLATATPATELNNVELCDGNDGHYSVLRLPSRACTDLPEHTHSNATLAAHNGELLNVEWLQGEILAFTVIGLAQIRGGTRLLGDVWYAAAVLAPPLLKIHPDSGTKLNYFAITPPFVALGLLNGYLRHDRAYNTRVFLSNFIGFNLSLAWAHTVWNSPERFFATAEPSHVPQLDASVFALRDGGGLYVAYRW